jgi:hypothetical protein
MSLSRTFVGFSSTDIGHYRLHGRGFYGRLKSITTQDLADLLEDHPEEDLQLELKGLAPEVQGKADLVFPMERVAQAMCSMRNTVTGRMILGADADKQEKLSSFTGVPENRCQALYQRLQRTAAQIQPPVPFEWHWVAAPDGRGWVMIVEIPVRTGGIHQYKGTYWMRIGRDKVPMPHPMVIAAILADEKAGGRLGWSRVPLDSGYPFQPERDDRGQEVDHWMTGVVVRAPFPAENFFDGLGDISALQGVFAAERLNLKLALHRDRATYATPKYDITVNYSLSATVLKRVDTVPLVTKKKLAYNVQTSLRRAARFLDALKYRGPVEVHCTLARRHASALEYQPEDDGAVIPVLWRTTEVLERDVLLPQLVANQALWSKLSERFCRAVERNPDLAKKDD